MIRRRLYIEERVSPTARWSFRFALFAVPVLVLSVLLYRLGLLDFTLATVAFAAGLLVAVVGGLLGVIAFFITWESGWIGIGRAIAAVALAGGGAGGAGGGDRAGHDAAGARRHRH